ncbi:MAG TPA: GNAT family N-acetyltransferase [Rhabdaerophilum sp.]|nr:GNAT family N-acetyltransferase [Rhabdaerophilum sp.]
MFTIKPGDFSDARVIALIRHHFERNRAVTPSGSAHVLDISALQRPEIAFFALWDGNDLLGIGALRDFGDGTGEIKSMRTADHALRRGVAAEMLGHLMGHARAIGLNRLYLETGSFEYFAPARALYARHGFVACSPFAGYRNDPNSTFMTCEL